MSGNGSGIETIPAQDAPTKDAPNRIVVNFPDDHSISGMKVEIIGVTPEQIAIAIFHLGRSADQVADMRQLQGAREQAEIERIRRDLAKGH